MQSMIIKVQIRDLEFENDLLSQTTVNWNPSRSRLLNNFPLVVLLDDKPPLVRGSQNKFAPKPFKNLGITLAICLPDALFKLDDK